MNNDILFIKSQEEQWELLRNNRNGLSGIMVREIPVGGMIIEVQFNPCRAISNSAKVDKASIASRKCFLCGCNRQKEQTARNDIQLFETLANPFPIFQAHLTIASVSHVDQDLIDLKDMADFLKKDSDALAFYNGSRSGASAPDHLHFQSCGLKELRLPDVVENMFGKESFPPDSPKIVTDLPMKFWLADISDEAADKEWDDLNLLTGYDPSTMLPDKGFRNILMYRTNDHTRCIIIPRKKHRPRCYYAEDESQHLSVSPGAVDMAGKIIVPHLQDFERLSAADIVDIYEETGLTSSEIKRQHKLLLNQ